MFTLAQLETYCGMFLVKQQVCRHISANDDTNNQWQHPRRQAVQLAVLPP